MKKEAKKEIEKVKVEAIEVRPTKPQHLTPGKVYEVDPDKAKSLIRKKFAKSYTGKQEPKEPKGDK